MRNFLIGASLVLLAACTPDSQQPEPQAEQRSARVVGGFLTHSEAQYRKRAVVNPEYTLAIELDKTEGTFGGAIDIAFTYRGDGGPLSLDFRNGEILSLSLNGESVEYQYNDYFITLPAGSLEPGEQLLRIEYEHPYSQDGAGLYRYVDPEDGKVYLYTDFEPYDASRMYPHFDQPDLKARYTLSVRAPAGWEVVSTTRESSVVEDGDDRVWEFPTTALMSSYIFSLHAGEYVVFEDKDFRYPLRLFARQSMAQYVKAEEWFGWTRQGFDFFDEYFNLPYPFEKYDQLLVPDYNSGAMENIAAVTFSETYLSRGEATRREKLNLANVIMHEMAHMWFGDITTMAWWNGLWLNESFATYMAELALYNATEFSENWQEFFMGTKSWAYREDQWVTTHSIELPVGTTDDAFTNFDGITYGKGASVLKQLGALLGEDVFRQGVRDYLAANAWSNTELDDFMGAMAQASKRDLGDWTQRWLYEAGLNSIEAQFSCEDGVITRMQLVQAAPDEYPTLREQRTQVGLYVLRDGVLELERSIKLLFDGQKTTVLEAGGAPCPDFVYPNFEDWAYIKVILDPRSIATARADMNALKDPMQRTMAWYDLFSMAQSAELPLTEYLEILATNMPTEQDLSTAADLLLNLRTSFGYLHQVPGGAELIPVYAARFEPLLWQLIESSDGDARQQWLKGYIDTANNEAAWQRLTRLLKGEITLPGFELDQDQRWRIVMKLSEFHRPGYEALAEAEATRDGSAIGQENAIRVKVLAARGKEKGEWLQQAVSTDESTTLRRRGTILRGLFPYSSQRHMAAPFADDFIARLPALSEAHAVLIHDRITANLMPLLCTPENVQRLKAAAVRYADLNPAIVRGLKVAAQLDERCVNIGKLLATQ
jgi:aminopeptidase N